MSSLLILKIILIILTIRIFWLIFVHLTITFWDKATEDVANEIMKDPKEYVRSEHICKFMYNMIWLYIFIKLLIGAFNGQITID